MKNLKSYIEEGLLQGMDQTLASGQDTLNAAMNIDTLPSVKDFKKNPYNKDVCDVAWYCPNVLKKYKSLYPDMILNDHDSIHFALDKFDRSTFLDIYIGAGVNYPVANYCVIYGWHDSLAGATLAKYKSIVIKLIDNIARNPQKLDKIMAYAYECRKQYNDVKDNPDKTYKKLKSLLSLQYEKI